MPQTMTLSAVAAIVLGGSAAGLYLGNSAIGEIDPAYMMSDERESRFYADMVPGGTRVDEAPSALHNASLDQGLGSGCVGCITYPEEYVPRHDPAMDGYLGSYAAYSPPSAEEIVTEVDAVLAEAARTHFEEVERYAYYPVRTADELEEPAQVAVRAAALETAEEADCLLETQCEGQPTPDI